MMIAGTVLSVLGALGCWYFVVAYWVLTRGDWHQSAVGRHLMQFMANLAVLFSLIVLVRLFGNYPGRPVITTVAYAVFVAQIWWRIVLMHRAQRRDSARTRGPARR